MNSVWKILSEAHKPVVTAEAWKTTCAFSVLTPHYVHNNDYAIKWLHEKEKKKRLSKVAVFLSEDAGHGVKKKKPTTI